MFFSSAQHKIHHHQVCARSRLQPQYVVVLAEGVTNKCLSVFNRFFCLLQQPHASPQARFMTQQLRFYNPSCSSENVNRITTQL